MPKTKIDRTGTSGDRKKTRKRPADFLKPTNAISYSSLVVALAILIVLALVATLFVAGQGGSLGGSSTGLATTTTTLTRNGSSVTITTTMSASTTTTTESRSITTTQTLTNSTTITVTVTNSSGIERLESLISGLSSNSTTLQQKVISESQVAGSLNSSLESQLSSVSSLSSEASALNSQLSNSRQIVSLQNSTRVVAGAVVTEDPGVSVEVVSFSAVYAGYIVVSGTSSTTSGYVRASDSFSGYQDYMVTIGTSGSVLIPVLPGTVAVFFGNNNLINPASANLTVTYYY